MFVQYYIEPDHGGKRFRFRSKTEVLEYIKTGKRRPTISKNKTKVESSSCSSTTNASDAILALMERRMGEEFNFIKP